MGYFNYFIKCIIRKFVNLIFKPKILITFIIVISLLSILQITSRAEGWNDSQISDVQTKLFEITQNLDYQLQQLEVLSNNSANQITKLEWINGELVNIRNTLNSIRQDNIVLINTLPEIITNLETLNTEVLNIYNTLEENQQELLTELEKDNQAVLEELNMIRDAINGSEEEFVTYNDKGFISSSNSSDSIESLKHITIDYEKRYTYTIKVYFENAYPYFFDMKVLATDNILSSGYVFADYPFVDLGRVPANTSSYVLTYEIPSDNPSNIYITWGTHIKKIEVYRSIKGIVESLNQSNTLQQQQNQLQQQQNQIQQEQNDLIKDDNVNTDGLEFATDDTVNPTSDGFNTLFNTIYNAFCNTSSQPLTITLPFINKTFTIQPNIVSNGMQKAGLGVIVTLINSFYYFSVCLFIYKDIGKIVDNLKSGNITSDCGNVKTEVL